MNEGNVEEVSYFWQNHFVQTKRRCFFAIKDVLKKCWNDI